MFMFGRLIDVRFFLVEENKKRESFDRCLYFKARDIGTLILSRFRIEERKQKEIFDRCLSFNARDIGTLI